MTGKPRQLSHAGQIESWPAAENFNREALLPQLLPQSAQFIEAREDETKPTVQVSRQPHGEHFCAADIQAVQDLKHRRHSRGVGVLCTYCRGGGGSHHDAALSGTAAVAIS